MTQDEIISKAKQQDEIELVDFIKLAILQERKICAEIAEWCIENHLEHHIPERIRARGNASIRGQA
jgi:hypothetical protein